MEIEKARYNMVEQQIRPCNIFDKGLLDLLLSIKRELFMLPEYKNIAFSDIQIPLPGKQKMFYPRIDAILIQELQLRKQDRVFEVGTGSGYVTAILAKLSEFVYSIEIDEQNKQFAMQNLTSMGINNISIYSGNGTIGFMDSSPFDKIFIGGALKKIPNALKSQLAIGGMLVGIVGNNPIMHGVKLTRISSDVYEEKLLFETSADYLLTENTDNFNF
jgi:protein-L-isoaspartate(D-aspartate) O-methyltransferase